MKVFDTKDPSEIVTVTFDFTSELGSETISGSPTVTNEVAGGTDAAFASMLNGAPSASGGNKVLQSVKLGVHGVNYKLKALVNTSASRTLVLSAILPVRSA